MTAIEIIKALVEAGEDIQCFPEGATGIEEWHEAKRQAEEFLGETLDYRAVSGSGYSTIYEPDWRAADRAER